MSVEFAFDLKKDLEQMGGQAPLISVGEAPTSGPDDPPATFETRWGTA